MGPSALEQFLAHVQADPALRRQVSEAITADEVSLLAPATACPGSQAVRARPCRCRRCPNLRQR
jgi:hypothetical protein